MPSMKEINIDNVQMQGDPGDRYFRKNQSPVERLIFKNPCLTQKLMFNSLRRFGALQYLCWDERQSQDFAHATSDPRISPFWLCVALSMHTCKSSLQHLVIRTQDTEDAFLGDLTALESLQHLETDLPALINQHTEEVIRLPDTVTELTVHCDHGSTSTTRKGSRQMLKLFLKSGLLGAESLETLRMQATITTRGGGVDDSSTQKAIALYRKLKRRAKRVGVAFREEFWVDGRQWSREESRAALKKPRGATV